MLFEMWTLIFYQKDRVQVQMYSVLRQLTIDNLSAHFNISCVVIYAHEMLNVSEYANQHQVILIPEKHAQVNGLLFALNHAMSRQQNIIFFDHAFGFMGQTKLPVSTQFISGFHVSLFRQSTIDHHILFIPYAEKHDSFIKSLTLFMQSNDVPLSTGLLFVATRMNIHLHTMTEHKNVIHLEHTPDRQYLQEVILSRTHYPTMIKHINLDTHFYFPFLDVNTDRIYVQKEAHIMNVNGYAMELDQTLLSHLYLRYATVHNGVLIRKSKIKHQIIPYNIHHIWFEEIDERSVNAWKHKYYVPWTYFLWTSELIEKEFSNSPWFVIYERSEFPEKYMITNLMILEKYGGICIVNNMMPRHKFDALLFSNTRALALKNEKYGPSINYRIMASVERPFQHEVDFNLARKPYIQSFDNVGTQDTFFTDLWHALTSSSNISHTLVKHFLQDKLLTIYPSYYFDIHEHLPREFKQVAFAYAVEPEYTLIEAPVKMPLIREHHTSVAGMLTRLLENPVTRLFNHK